MELPHVGVHCDEATCHRLDFLPVVCDACKKSFCMDHMTYAKHQCPNAKNKDVQVPVCPLCNSPVSSPRGQAPDIAVSGHIDRDCQSDPAKNQRKLKRNKCNATGCKIKEIIPVLCSDCQLNFCLKHRFAQDHQCKGIKGRVSDAAQKRARNSNSSLSHKIQGVMSEDEALARALAESMKDAPRQRPVAPAGGSSNNSNCRVS